MDANGCKNPLKQPGSEGVWFVYGSLKPAELGFRQIERFIESHEPAQVSGCRIMIRDGLPGLENNEGGVVDGHLLYAKLGKEIELQSVIELFETKAIYKFDNVEVINSSEICVQATATFFKNLNTTNDEPFESPTWSVSDDRYFQYGLPILFKMAHESRKDGGPGDSPHFWQEYLPIMGTFMNLWTVLERYMKFAQPGLEPEDKENEAKGATTRNVRALENSDAGKRAYDKVINKHKGGKLLRSDGGDKGKNEDRYLAQWNVIRDNSAHRGKSAYSDYRRVRNAALGLSEFLVALLSQEVNGLEHLKELLDVNGMDK